MDDLFSHSGSCWTLVLATMPQQVRPTTITVRTTMLLPQVKRKRCPGFYLSSSFFSFFMDLQHLQCIKGSPSLIMRLWWIFSRRSARRSWPRWGLEKILIIEISTCVSQVGLQELFSFKQKNPHVDLEPFLAQSSQYFRLLLMCQSCPSHIKLPIHFSSPWGGSPTAVT